MSDTIPTVEPSYHARETFRLPSASGRLQQAAYDRAMRRVTADASDAAEHIARFARACAEAGPATVIEVEGTEVVATLRGEHVATLTLTPWVLAR